MSVQNVTIIHERKKLIFEFSSLLISTLHPISIYFTRKLEVGPLERYKMMKLIVISIPVTPELWGVGSRESAVGECGIIDLDFIILIQPETILHRNT